MAPRETRIETSSPKRLSQAAAQRLMEETAREEAKPAERRGPKPARAAAAPAEEPASMKDADTETQAATLESASEGGDAFCEECARDEEEGASDEGEEAA